MPWEMSDTVDDIRRALRLLPREGGGDGEDALLSLLLWLRRGRRSGWRGLWWNASDAPAVSRTTVVRGRIFLRNVEERPILTEVVP